MLGRSRKRSKTEVLAPGRSARTAGPGTDNPLVYDVDTGSYYYLLTKRKRSE